MEDERISPVVSNEDDSDLAALVNLGSAGDLTQGGTASGSEDKRKDYS